MSVEEPLRWKWVTYPGRFHWGYDRAPGLVFVFVGHWILIVDRRSSTMSRAALQRSKEAESRG